MKTEKNKSLIFTKYLTPHSDVAKQFHAPFGTIVCYNGNSALEYTIVDSKDGSDFILCEDFPYLAFCGNIIDGTQKPDMVVNFIKYHGEDIATEEVEQAISDFKKSI